MPFCSIPSEIEQHCIILYTHFTHFSSNKLSSSTITSVVLFVIFALKYDSNKNLSPLSVASLADVGLLGDLLLYNNYNNHYYYECSILQAMVK